MSKRQHPKSQDQKSYKASSKALDDLSLEDIESKIDRFLYEAIDICKDYIAQGIRDKYCQAKKLHILPPAMIDPVKAKADEIFIHHFQNFSCKVMQSKTSTSKEL